jgi:hypothetical protein
MHVTIYTYNKSQNNHAIFTVDLEQQKVQCYITKYNM